VVSVSRACSRISRSSEVGARRQVRRASTKGAKSEYWYKPRHSSLGHVLFGGITAAELNAPETGYSRGEKPRKGCLLMHP